MRHQCYELTAKVWLRILVIYYVLLQFIYFECLLYKLCKSQKLSYMMLYVENVTQVVSKTDFAATHPWTVQGR